MFQCVYLGLIGSRTRWERNSIFLNIYYYLQIKPFSSFYYLETQEHSTLNNWPVFFSNACFRDVWQWRQWLLLFDQCICCLRPWAAWGYHMTRKMWKGGFWRDSRCPVVGGQWTASWSFPFVKEVHTPGVIQEMEPEVAFHRDHEAV